MCGDSPVYLSRIQEDLIIITPTSCEDNCLPAIYNLDKGGQRFVPTISRFFGIVVAMFWQDHMPPHFHAIYGDDEALIDIHDAVVLRGHLPSSRVKLVLAWAEIHRDELLENWARAQKNESLVPIDPLR